MTFKRLFIGFFIELDSLKELKDSFSEHILGKWTEPENLHVTLRFLGDFPSSEIGSLIESLKDSLSKTPKRRLKVRGVGTFGSPARILWLGIDGELKDIKLKVDRALEPFGFEAEQRYTPHLTVARIKKLRRRQVFERKLAKKADKVFSDFLLSEIFLIESKLTRSGPIYTRLKSFELE